MTAIITPTVTGSSSTPNPVTTAPIMSIVPDPIPYVVTDDDRALITTALSRFAQDYRYLLDMVTAATKADRASGSVTSPVDLSQLTDPLDPTR